MIDTRSLPSAVALEDVLRRGREELEAGHVEGALRTFDDAIRIKPTYAPAWRAKGRALRAAGDPKSALGCYAEALRHEPDDEASWFGLALALHQLGQRKDEVRAYDELLRRNPRNVAAWMNKGVALHEAGAFAEAIACYDRILSVRPEVVAAWNNRGAALLRLGRFADALTAFDEALALDPGFGDAAANRKTALARLNRDEPPPPAIALPDSVALPPAIQARVLANMGLSSLGAFKREPPSAAPDFLALGTALLDDGSPESALAAFARAESLGAGAEAVLGRLLAHQVLGHPDLAAEASRARERFPDHARVVFATAAILEESGDADGALSALGPFAEAHPDLAWAWMWKGLLELRSGRPGDARMSFESSTAVDPDDADGWTNLAAAAFMEKDVDGALAACDRALALDSEHPSAWNNRGVILAAMGRAKEAEAALRRGARESSEITIARNRAALAEARGQHRAAAALYTGILSRRSGDGPALAGRRRALGRLGAQARRKRKGRRSR